LVDTVFSCFKSTLCRAKETGYDHFISSDSDNDSNGGYSLFKEDSGEEEKEETTYCPPKIK